MFGGAPGTSAQTVDDPASVVEAYVDALNAHDLAAALALFDQNGSATDAQGRHFEGRDGLTEFLLANGFGAANMRIATTQLQVFGNRALWTYTCSCSAQAASKYGRRKPTRPHLSWCLNGGPSRWFAKERMLPNTLFMTFAILNVIFIIVGTVFRGPNWELVSPW